MMSIRSLSKDGAENKRKMLRLPKIHELFNLRYYFMNIRLQWPLFMLFAIALFFAMPVVILFGVQDISGRFTIEWKYTNVIEVVSVSSYLIAIGAGLFASTAVTRDFMKQSSTNFVHALPVRREAQLLVRLAAGATVYIAAFALNIVLGMLTTVLVGASQYIGMLFPLIGTSLMTFVFIYTLNTACGMLCGTSITQFILTALTLILPPLTYAMTLGWISEHVWDFWGGWYTTQEKLEFFPGTRLMYRLFDNDVFGGMDYLYFGIMSVLLIAVSVVLYRMRINEHASDAAMFAPVGPIVKYVSMVPAALIGGMFFYEAANDNSVKFLWWMFGWVCAALLTFMLVNAVVHRSAKAVMKGIKWAPIFGGVFLVLNILIMGDAANLSGYVPNPSTLSSATLNVDGMDIVLKDKNNLIAMAQLTAAANKPNANSQYNVSRDAYEKITYGSRTEMTREEIDAITESYDFTSNYVSFRVAFRLKGGAVIAKQYNIGSKTGIEDVLRTITDSPEFSAQYKQIVEKYGESEFYASLGIAEGDNSSFSSSVYGYTDEYGIFRESEPALIDMKTDEVNSAYFARPLLGTVHIYGTKENNYSTAQLPLFLDDPLTAEVDKAAKQIEAESAARHGDTDTYGGAMTSENLEAFTDRFIQHIGITDTATGEAYTFTKKSELYEIMRSVQSVGENSVSMFSIPDSRYFVSLWFKEPQHNEYYFVTFFLDGQVPQFVLDHFAE